MILELLEDGSLNLTTVGLLAPHLTDENHQHVLDAARHRSKREVEHQVAALHPRPDVSSSVRKLHTPKPLETQRVQSDSLPAEAANQSRLRRNDEASGVPTPCAPILSPPVRPAVIAPLAPERYQITFTVGRETHDKLRRAQDLLRHAIPNGDPAAVRRSRRF